jgi:unsaturated rhamnogalacturonyl hydrolase
MKSLPGLRLQLFLLSGLCIAAGMRAADMPAAKEFAGATPLQWSVRMADAEIGRRGNGLIFKEGGKAKWDYTVGLFTLSLVRLGETLNEPRYGKFAESVIGSFISTDGQIRSYRLEDYNLDSINSGKTALALYAMTKDERYRQAAALLRKQFETQPRTSEGGFWHKQRYPHQMWLDGLYMGAPFYAECAQLFKDSAAFDDVAKQIRLVAAHTYDAKTGLFYHGWDESKTQSWASKTTGCSPNFWSRAIGWYAMALVDALDYFPADHPARPEIVATLQRVAAGIVKYQDATSGLWYQVTDQGDRKGNYLEATGSSMFVYALAKGINHGYLSRDYVTALLKGYTGLVEKLVRVDSKGPVTLTQCCQVAGLGYNREGTFEYYIGEPVVDNDLKGVGPFILAGIELQKLLGLPAAVAAPPVPVAIAAHIAAPAALEWTRVGEVLARIKAPVFPNREFPITDFGAAADGKTDCTDAIRQAIAACSQAGGGRVTVSSAGIYLTGPIQLKSNIELCVSEGCTLQFITDPARYLPVVWTRWEGTECLNYSPLIYAFEQENIAVTGGGTLDGGASGENWWAWTKRVPLRDLAQHPQPEQAVSTASVQNERSGPAPAKASRDRLVDMGERGVPVEQRVFGAGHFLRPSFIQPYRCRNVLIEGVRIRRSPMWEINPVLCTNVTVRGVNIVSDGPNNDGCDPDSCRDVLIEDCQFTTGDDCIAIKSGRNNDGRRVGVPSENLVVRRCTMKDGHGGVVIGSEISGGCRNVFVEDCVMDSPNLDRALRFKSNARRGGVIENVFMRNVEIGQVAEAVLTVDFLYEEGARGDFRPAVRNVVLEHVTSRSSPRVMWIKGFPGALIDGVRFSDCTFTGVSSAEVLQNAGTISFTNVTIAPAVKVPSLNSRPPQ